MILAGGPWIYSYRTTRNPTRYTYPMEAYLQPVDSAGHYVGYCRLDERESGSTGNSVDVPISLASSFDLDALWQAHAADLHPPDVEQGETVFTDSAAVSGLKPLGRV